MKTPEEMAEEWVKSDLAQDIANAYEVSATTFLGQQSTFQAHLDGQDSGFKNGFLAGYQAAKPQWISVKERLPEPLQPCIGFREIMGTYSVVRIASNGKWMFCYKPDYASGITHWMPLSNPLEEV